MWFDISIPMSSRTPEWPGDEPFSCHWPLRLENGNNANVSSITTSLHIGTHADAPVHLRSDWPAAENLELGSFIGDATVVVLPKDREAIEDIDVPLLSHLLGNEPVTRVLLRTNSTIANGKFPTRWPALTPQAAEWLVSRSAKLWGVDAPSVDLRSSNSLEVHHILLGQGVAVIENLNLNNVSAGAYELIAPPLAVEGADAAPLRALLRNR